MREIAVHNMTMTQMIHKLARHIIDDAVFSNHMMVRLLAYLRMTEDMLRTEISIEH